MPAEIVRHGDLEILEVIARLIDRARGRGRDSTEQWTDDEVSPL
jgi:sec-independent protein translocase protein TatC